MPAAILFRGWLDMAASPAQTAFARVRSVDVFGVLLPGLYLLASCAFVIEASRAVSWRVLEHGVLAFVHVGLEWFPAFVGLCFAYLLGSLLKAFPVDRVDAIVGWAVRRFKKEGTDYWRLYASSFPYPEMLDDWRRGLRALGYDLPPEGKVQVGSGTDAHAAFDYWKAQLLFCEPAVGPEIHALEARTRLFCGLAWAGAVASSFALVVTLSTMNVLPLASWAVSLPMTGLFGWRLRHVRGDEARQVFLFYLAHCSRGPHEPRREHANGPPTKEAIVS